MTSAKFDPQQFFQGAEHVALNIPAGEVFGVLKRRLDLPGAWGALVRRQSGDHEVVRPGAVIDGDEADTVLFVRTTPVEVTLSEDQLTTKDGFTCRAETRLRVSVIPERSDLLSFIKAVLGSRRVVQADDLGRYLQPVSRAALAEFAGKQSADALIEPQSGDAAAAAIAEALQAPCFTGGLSLGARPVVRFESDAAREVQRTREQAARRCAEHEASSDLRRAIEHAQNEHLGHLTSVLTRVNELAAASPDAALPDLLRTFSEHQRSELYQALFAAETASVKTGWIVIAAGDELLFFEPGAYERPKRRLSITGSAGPIRSAQTVPLDGGLVLWLGGSTGVYRLPLDRSEPDLALLVPNAPPVRGGFNAVTQSGTCVVGSHSELGLWRWDVNEPDGGRAVFESMTGAARAVRHVQAREGRFYCSIDDRVISWPADGGDRPDRVYTGSRATITALLVNGDGIYAGNSDGDVLFWRADGLDKPERIHTGGQRPAESVWLLDTHGVRRLFFTDTSLCVHARVVGDSFTCGYEAGGQTLRRVEVAPDLVVATSELRDRVFVWQPGEPGRPAAIINVGSLCGRSVQDVCLVGAG